MLNRYEKKNDPEGILRIVLSSISLLLLCVNIVTTAVILQMAHLQRGADVPDDTLPASIMSYIHPGTMICLLLGYMVWIGSLIILHRWWRARHLPCHPAGRPDCMASPDRDNS